MSPIDLAAIAARADAATPGPWERASERADIDSTVLRHGVRVVSASAHRRPRWLMYGEVFHIKSMEANLEFAAHAREDVPALLAEVDRLRAALKDIADRWPDYTPHLLEHDAETCEGVVCIAKRALR